MNRRCALGIHYREKVEYPKFIPPCHMLLVTEKRCKRCEWSKVLMYHL